MGNYKFRLSDMMPNAWFYKLKDMSSKRKNTKNTSMKQKQSISSPSTKALPQKPKQKQSTLSQSRKSYHFTRDPNNKFYNNLFYEEKKKSSSDFPDPARKSSKPRKSNSKRPHVGFSESRSDESLSVALSSSCNADDDDIIMYTSMKFDPIPELDLPPIITKKHNGSAKTEDSNQRNGSVIAEDAKQRSGSFRRHSGNSPGLKLRTKSPRIANITTQGRRSFSTSSSSCSSSHRRRTISSQSFAVAKSSFDPQRDFMESMMEMIVENNIRASKDLEELLACYLALNSDEYHDLIIKVFKQIWFDLSDMNQSK